MFICTWCFHPICFLIIAASNIVNGVYRYTSDLLALVRTSQAMFTIDLPEGCCQIIPPLTVDKWEDYLRSRPDKEFTSFILYGITCSFQIGCNYLEAVIRSSWSNMPATRAQSDVVINYFKKELDLGRMVAVPHEAVGLIHTSTFRGITKSSPHGSSVNDYNYWSEAFLSHLRLSVWCCCSHLEIGSGNCWQSWTSVRHIVSFRCTLKTVTC